MWNRLNQVNLKNVAGSIRSTVSEFANEVAKQAQTLAEEDAGESPGSCDVHEPAYPSQSTVTHAEKSHSSISARPGQPSNPQAARQPAPVAAPAPVASKITALKAKLEAEKARKQAMQRPPEHANLHGNAHDNERSGERADQSVAVSPSGSDLTPPDSLRASPAWTPEQQDRHLKGISQNNPLYAQSQAPSQDASPEVPVKQTHLRDRSQRTLQEHGGKPFNGPGGKADDFVDIPLHSPDGLPAKARPNGLRAPSKQGAKLLHEKSLEERSEVSQLRDQLQRLKKEMFSGAQAQEEEQARLQQEIGAQSDMIARLEFSLENESRQRREAVTLEQHQSDLAAVKAASDNKLIQERQQWQRQANLKDAEVLAANQELESLRQAESVQEPASQPPKDETRALQQQVEQLQAKIAQQQTAFSELQELREALARASEHEARLQEELQTLQQALAATKRDSQLKAEELEASSAQQMERIAALEADLVAERDAHEGTLRDAEASMLETESLRAQVGSPNEAAEAFSAQMRAETDARLAAEAASVEADCRFAEAQRGQQQAASVAEEKDTIWTNEVQQLERRLEQTVTRAEQAETSQLQLQEDFEKLKAQHESDKAALLVAEGQMQMLQREKAELEGQLSASQLALQIAESARDEAESRIASHKVGEAASNELARRQEQEWAAKLQQQQEQQRTLQAQLQEKEEALRAAQAELEELRVLQTSSRASVLAESNALQQELSQKQAELTECEQLLAKSQQEREEALAMQRVAKEEVSEVRQDLQVAKKELAVEEQKSSALQQQVEQLTAASSQAAETQKIQQEADERQYLLQRQLLASQATCSQLQARLESIEAGTSPDDASRKENRPQADGENLRAALLQAEAERDRAKQQFTRLKQQMLSEQDEEDDKLRWRVEAEVQAALSQARAAAAARQEAAQAREAELSARLVAAEQQVQSLTANLAAWEAAVAERDTELRNLQGALGELTYESEAAERLRAEVRAARSRHAELQRELANAQEACKKAEAVAAAAEAQTAAKQQSLETCLGRERSLAEEANMLRRAVQESMKRINMLNSDSGAMVDRRIIVKLLVTYFQRGQSPEILDLMARMLGLSDSDKAAIKGSRKGVLRSVAAVPYNLVQGTVNLARTGSNGSVVASEQGGESLADSWVDFLIQQAQAADAAEKNDTAVGSSLPAE